jgi:hypothetical protein
MATIKKSMAFRPKAKAGIKLKKAQNGTEEGKGPSDDYKERQFGKVPAKSQEGEGPSSDEKSRQGDRAPGAKTPPNKFTPVTPPASAPEKKQSFGEAFKAARAAKKGTFEWNGKKYTSDTKEDAAKKSNEGQQWKEAAGRIKSRIAIIDNKKLSPKSSSVKSNAPAPTLAKSAPAKSASSSTGSAKSIDSSLAGAPDRTTRGLRKGGTVKKKMKTGGKIANGPVGKKFAALAAPKNKITFADKIAGAKKVVKAVSKKK